MDYAVTTKSYQRVLKQKKLFLILFCVSLLLNVLQTAERLLSSEKIIILPPVITKEVWIKGNTVSESVLEEWALYLTNLLLNASSKTIAYQSELALRHVSPEFTQSLNKKFKEDALRLQKNNAATTFYPKEIRVDEKKMTVVVTGTFSTFVGKEKVSSHEQTYHLQFVFNQGRFLQLKQFKQITAEGTDVEHEAGFEHTEEDEEESSPKPQQGKQK